MKTTKKEADALEWVCQQITQNTRQPGEFTIFDAMAKNPGITRAALRSQLDRMVSSGGLKRRLGNVDGQQTTLFSKA